MTQEQFDKLIKDGAEIGWGIDQYEIINFFNELSDKYNLIFNEKDYITLDAEFVKDTDIKQYGKHIDSENTYQKLWNTDEEKLIKGLTNE